MMESFYQLGSQRISRAWVLERKHDLMRLADLCESLIVDNDALRSKLIDSELQRSVLQQSLSLKETTLVESKALLAQYEQQCTELRAQLAAEHDSIIEEIEDMEPGAVRSNDEVDDGRDHQQVPVEYAAGEHASVGDGFGAVALPIARGEYGEGDGDEGILNAEQRRFFKQDFDDPPSDDASGAGPSFDLGRIASLAVFAAGAVATPPMNGGAREGLTPPLKRAGAKFGRVSYHCDVCRKSFPTPSSLRIHSVVHTGERPYKCEGCGRGFTQSSSLGLHRRMACPARAVAENDQLVQFAADGGRNGLR